MMAWTFGATPAGAGPALSLNAIAVGLALALGIGQAAAQSPQASGAIKGVVTATESQTPLAGATVSLIGTTLRAVAGEDGRFEISSVPPGTYQLQAVHLGRRPIHQPVRVAAGETVTVDLAMTVQTVMLDQVFVTGTAGGARQREVGNSIATISRDSATDIPINTETMLQAQSPGLTVMQNSAQIGGSAEIRLRGVVSASMSNQPLVFVDGVRVRSEPYRTTSCSRTTRRCSSGSR